MTDRRAIPSIDRLYQRQHISALEPRYGRAAIVDALRSAAEIVRKSPDRADATADEELVSARIESLALEKLDEMFRTSLHAVINATGVIVHTNLGRAPLSDAALARVAAVGRGYSTLEYDLAAGRRGRRDVHAESLLCRLTGAEAATVVNNNAAATLLVLAAIAAGREVIVSRGELVEIGGGFRIPDVMKQSGARLREVGTTNRTRAADYAAAIGDRTALILRVHPSNFRIEGFTVRPMRGELVDLGRRFQVPVFEDLGSGFLRQTIGAERGRALTAAALDAVAQTEPAVEDSIADGVDLCCFSGDKLLGGPQSGIILGRRSLVEIVRRHPLMRALRVDKMTYAALDATLAEYAAGRAASTVPVPRMLAADPRDLQRRAELVASAIGEMPGWHAGVGPSTSAVGGGSGPGLELTSSIVAIAKDGLGADALAAHLRQLTPPIVPRIEQDKVVLDLRTVFPEQDSQLVETLRDSPPKPR